MIEGQFWESSYYKAIVFFPASSPGKDKLVDFGGMKICQYSSTTGFYRYVKYSVGRVSYISSCPEPHLQCSLLNTKQGDVDIFDPSQLPQKFNIDTQHDAIFEAGHTFSPSHLFSYPFVKFPNSCSFSLINEKKLTLEG